MSPSDALARAAQAAGLEAVGPLAGELACLAVVLDDAHELARLRDGVEAEDPPACPAPPSDAVAEEVVHRADLAPVRAGEQRIADVQRAALDQDRHDGATAR
jgi:hypothetical protein